MSRTCHCDVCEEIIKSGDKKALLATKQVIHLEHEDEEIQDMHSYLKKINQKWREIEVREICMTCKNILIFLFKIRREEREKILEKIEKSYNPKYTKPEKKGKK